MKLEGPCMQGVPSAELQSVRLFLPERMGCIVVFVSLFLFPSTEDV